MLTLDGQQPATIVGITSFGDTDALDQGGTVSIPDATAFDWLNSGNREYEDLYLRGGGSQSELRDAVQPAVPNGFKAQTGEEFLDDQRSQAGSVRSRPADRPAGVRIDRPVRRRVRHLQHVQRDRRPTDARAGRLRRDRRDATTDPPLARGRGTVDRRPRLGARRHRRHRPGVSPRCRPQGRRRVAARQRHRRRGAGRHPGRSCSARSSPTCRCGSRRGGRRAPNRSRRCARPRSRPSRTAASG